MFDDLFWIIIAACAAALVVCIAVIIKEVKKTKMTKEEQEAYYEEYFANEGDITLTYAEVVDMACGTKVVGSRSPKCVESYVVTFRTEKGEILQIDVDHEMYDAIDIGMAGMLRLVDGRLNSFEPDNI